MSEVVKLRTRAEIDEEAAAWIWRMESGPAGGADPQALRTSLSLPGVSTEIHSIAATSRNSMLLDKDFTLKKIQQELGTGRFNRVHVASHAFLGDSARDSFLIAFDDVIRLDDLQALISARSHPIDIDLLTLSACDTAEGDEP